MTPASAIESETADIGRFLGTETQGFAAFLRAVPPPYLPVIPVGPYLLVTLLGYVFLENFTYRY